MKSKNSMDRFNSKLNTTEEKIVNWKLELKKWLRMEQREENYEM